ncbi:MAG: hypothetical protein ACLQGV_04695 [Bryobacteraceae bacterium]
MEKYIVHLVIWGVLATILVFLALYRRRVYMKSDESLHVLDAEAPLVDTQADVNVKLQKLDRCGIALTILVALYALAIAGVYIYNMFMDTSIKMG